MNSHSAEKKLFLLDAYALIFRAYYAFIKNPRITSSGLNTSAVLGFVNTLDEVLKKEKPDYIAVAFDPAAATFRNELYPLYKANRDATPEDIKIAVPYIKAILDAYRIPILQVQGFEADDVIGTIAKQSEKEGFTCYMMTPDKDYGQLLSENIFMYKPGRSGNEVEIVNAQDFCKKYGIEKPAQFIDILALWGDTSDNVPGVKGIGEKTAADLISKFGTIENIYQNIEKLKGKQKENLLADKEILDRARELVTIRLDVPIEFDAENCKVKEPDYEKLKSLFEELEFRALAARVIPPKKEDPNAQRNLFGEVVKPDLFNQPSQAELFAPNEIETKFETIHTTEHTYKLAETESEIEELINLLSQQSEFCFDTETDNIDPIVANLVGMSFSFKAHEAFYVPVPENRNVAETLVSKFKTLLESDKILKIGQNIKYDILVLQNYDIHVGGKLFDTMLAHYLLAPEKRHNLNVLSEEYLLYQPVAIEELIGEDKKTQISMRNVSKELIKEYAGEDADLTFQLKEIFAQKLVENELLSLAENIEFPLVYVLADMERNGVKIDKNTLSAHEQELTQRISETETQIYRAAGTHFNIASPKQLGIILFEKLKVTNDPKLTKTKQYATGEEELQKLKGTHEIVDFILEYRTLTKLLSTYVKALPELINPKTGLIHTSFNQAVTSTGRLSSTNPNLQNIPIRTSEGRRIREAFVPRANDRVIFSADYSQIELRLMAHMSQDLNMIQAFAHGEDIHTATAAKIFNIPLEDVTKDMRSQAKSANFGIIYGISSFGLSQSLNIGRSEAKALIDGYFRTYPDVKKHMDEAIRTGRETEIVKTIFGRKRFLQKINSRNAVERGNDERNAINAPLQGSAADVIKIAMINVQNELKKTNLDAKLILQVHDELVFDIAEKDVEKAQKIITDAMENAANLSVKLIAESNYGKDWLKAH